MERRLTVPPESKKTESNAIDIPSISVPQGGGAIKGIDEKFAVNSANGTASLSIPVPGNGARGFAPLLSIDYNSGFGNGLFGMGWSLSLPFISRKTDRGLPRYMDDIDSDVFIFGGAEDLVPELIPGERGGFDGEISERRDGQCKVRRYRPRTEGAFLRIERYMQADGDIYWKVTDRANVTTFYGYSSESRLCSPDGKRIFQWYPEFSYDNLGNSIEYVYLHESVKDIDLSKVSNRNRVRDGAITFSGICLLEARYGNRIPFREGDRRPLEEEYRFVTRFIYKNGREDAFSNYRSGFEVRTSRLCTNIQNIHRFEQLPGGEAIVSSLGFKYETSVPFTFLKAVSSTGYIKHEDGSYTSKSLPETVFSYQRHEWDRTLRTLDVESGQGFVFTDLYNEGIPGLLMEQEGNWYYRRNLGEGRFSNPVAVGSRPSFNGSGISIADLDSDGTKQLVNLSFEPKGFFEMDDAGTWSAMKRFKSLPTARLDSGECRLIDLSGDGRPDILVAENEVFTWYESKGREGFGTGEKVHVPFDEEMGACVSFNDATQSIFLADMSGDGLADIVRVRNGEVCYWPNLGYGRFGARITMENSPVFAQEGLFNPSMIRFSDIDGSGLSDIIYIGNGRFECWSNRCGASLSETPFIIDGIPEITTSSDISFVDLLGTGTACMVWSLPEHRTGFERIMYIDLMSGVKPHLLTGYETGAGKKVNFKYVSSVKFYLEDLFGGTPWNRRLPFPVQCLGSIEIRDLVTGHRFVSEYSYHDGHYDHAEKEFRGFGMVEQRDTEEFEKWKGSPSANLLREDLHQKPVITKTWFNTGSVDTPVTIGVLPGLDQSLISKLDLQSLREAHRAARGSAIRQTVTDSDGNLYSETHSSTQVLLVQPLCGNAHAVFMPLRDQEMNFSYDCGDMDDPRVSQTIALSYDDLGNPLESVAIVYPRKKTDESLPEQITAMQKECHVTLARSRYTNDIKDDSTYLLRVPFFNEAYVLENVPKQAEYYCREDFRSIDSHATLASRSLTLYYAGDFRSAAPEGEIHSLPVKYCNYVQAYTDKMVNDHFDGRVTDRDMEEARYCRLSGHDGWWISSGRVILLGDDETEEDLKSRFFMPLVYETALGARTRVHFTDNECLFLDSVEDPFGNVSKVLRFDYRTLSARKIEDINGNITETVTDELGLVIASAVMGKGNEADNLEGFGQLTSSEDEPLVSDLFKAKDYDEIEAIARRLLRGASSRLVYRLDTFRESGMPVCCAAIIREEHYAVNPNANLQIAFEYTGGMGEVVLTKVQAEAADGSDAVRWIGNGRTVVNNKGRAVMQYEPYFSETPEYEDAKEIVEKGVTPVIHYDALGRAVRTDMPDGTYSKVEFEEWKTTAYDGIDTVKDSEWLAKAKESADKWQNDAASKSEELSGTPLVTHYDSLGRGVFAIASDGSHSTTVFDKFGNTEKIIDSRENTVVRTTYDLLGNPTSVCGVDDGTRWILLDATGATKITWDQRRHRCEHFHDIAGRPTCSTVSGGEERILNNVITRVIYPEDLIGRTCTREELKRKNLLGSAVCTYDTSGKSEILRKDFAGRAIKSSYRLASNFKDTVDWRENNLDSFLEREEFITENRFDALGRNVWSSNPDGAEMSFEYGRGGMPRSQSLRMRGEEAPRQYIKSLVFNEKRQKCRIVYGNDVSVKYTYDPLSFRVVRVFSSKRSGEVLQDLNYTYDAVGNVTHLVDKAIPVEFNSNRMISGDSDYTYDMHYRLVCATGRENNAALRDAGANESNDRNFCSSFAPGDPVGLRNYTERYTYDSVGNILRMKHVSDGNNWTRDYEYEDHNNRLVATRMGDVVSTYQYHPQHGFMTGMEHLACTEWNFRGEMSMSSRQASNAGDGETTYYCYDLAGQRRRKVTVKGKTANGDDIIKDERIYFIGYEVYRCHSGVHAGLERISRSLSNDKGECYVMVESRNDVDDGTRKCLTRYQSGNVIGSVSLELDDKAEIISYEEFHPYGTTAFQAMNSSVKAAAKRYRYTGMERDEETGLAYHTARYYIPWLGRWSSPDPIGIDGGLNLYCYCGCNPVIRSDVSGTEWFWTTLEIVGEVLEIGGGVAACIGTMGVGCAVGAVAVVHGVDSLRVTVTNAVAPNENSRDNVGSNIAHHTIVNTLLYETVEVATGNKDAAEWAGTGADFVVGVGSGFAPGVEKLVAKGLSTAGKTAKNLDNAQSMVEEGTKAMAAADTVLEQGAEDVRFMTTVGKANPGETVSFATGSLPPSKAVVMGNVDEITKEAAKVRKAREAYDNASKVVRENEALVEYYSSKIAYSAQFYSNVDLGAGIFLNVINSGHALSEGLSSTEETHLKSNVTTGVGIQEEDDWTKAVLEDGAGIEVITFTDDEIKQFDQEPDYDLTYEEEAYMHGCLPGYYVKSKNPKAYPSYCQVGGIIGY